MDTDQVEKQTAQGAGICGIILLVCGVASLIPGFLLIKIDSSGHGLWSGIGLLLAGVLGVITWWRRHKGVIVGFLVITIIMIIVEFVQSIMVGILYSWYKTLSTDCSTISGVCYCSGSTSSKDMYCDSSKMESNVNSLLTVVISAVIGGIVCFIGSVFGCMGICASQQPGAILIQQPVMVSTTTLSGYQGPQPGYSVQQPGYSAPQPGYSAQQPGYSAPQPGYSVQQPGYSAQQPGYSAQQPGYMAPQPGYSGPQAANYSAPQATQQGTEQPRQPLPEEPPPVYTKHAL